MSSELELSKQRITELEAENVNLRRKLSVSDAEIAELKRRNNEFLRANKEYNERRDAENAKLRARIEELEKNKEDSSAENVRRDVEIAEIKAEVVKLAEGAQARDNSEESKQLTSRQSDVTSKEMISGYDQNTIDEIEPQSSVSSNNINLASNVNEKEDVSDHALSPSAKPSEEKETVAFLNEEHKKRVSEEIRQRNREKKLQRKNEQGMIQEVNSSMKEKHFLPVVTEISANQVRPNSLAEIDEERAVLPIINLYETARDHFTEKPNMEFTDEAEDEEQDDEVPEGSDQNNALEMIPPARKNWIPSKPSDESEDVYRCRTKSSICPSFMQDQPPGAEDIRL
ncbi:unnamed protein product [Rhizophagus irregularis]|nr:unnamed protein product [Rhizophagus irregularis]